MSRPDLLEVLFSLIIYWKSWENLASSRQDWSVWKVTDLDKSFHLLNFQGAGYFFLPHFVISVIFEADMTVP